MDFFKGHRRHMECFFPHHGRGYSGNLDGVSSVCDGHLSSVHDVQTGIQHSIVELDRSERITV